jgi:hypothetical protein
LIKQNKFEEGIPKIFFSEFPSTLKVFKQLFQVLPTFELVHLTIKCIVNNYQKNPTEFQKLLILKPNNNEEPSVEAIIIELIQVIKNDYKLLIVLIFIILL